jgi:hypothetical protein
MEERVNKEKKKKKEREIAKFGITGSMQVDYEVKKEEKKIEKIV